MSEPRMIETLVRGRTEENAEFEQLYATINGQLLDYAVAIEFEISAASTRIKVTSALLKERPAHDPHLLLRSGQPVSMQLKRGRSGMRLESTGEIVAVGGSSFVGGIGECESFVFVGNHADWQ